MYPVWITMRLWEMRRPLTRSCETSKSSERPPTACRKISGRSTQKSSGLKLLVSDIAMAARDAAKIKKMDGAATVELLERVKQAYRILFTRALKGVYLWIPDPITRAYLSDSLHQEVKRIGASPASAPTSQQKLIQSEKSDHLAELNTLLTVFETGVAGVMG